jgi:hypothetical protein
MHVNNQTEVFHTRILFFFFFFADCFGTFAIRFGKLISYCVTVVHFNEVLLTIHSSTMHRHYGESFWLNLHNLVVCKNFSYQDPACPCGLPHRLVHLLARDRALTLLRIPRMVWIIGQRWNAKVCCQLQLSNTRLAAIGRNEAKFKV